jgi:hypothetical protein
LSVSEKSPLGTTLTTMSSKLDALVMVTVCAVLGVPTSWLPKERVELERVTVAP